MLVTIIASKDETNGNQVLSLSHTVLSCLVRTDFYRKKKKKVHRHWLRSVGRRVIWQQHDNVSEKNKPFNYNGVREHGSTRYTRTISANGPTIGLYCAAYSVGRPEFVIDVVCRPNIIRFISRFVIGVHE